jgi:hypothetical protein
MIFYSSVPYTQLAENLFWNISSNSSSGLGPVSGKQTRKKNSEMIENAQYMKLPPASSTLYIRIDEVHRSRR